MTRLLSKLLVTAALLLSTADITTAAHADQQITIGYWDSAIGGPVVPMGTTDTGFLQYIDPLLGTGFGFGQIVALLTTGLGNGQNPTFEFAFNDGFTPPGGGTIRLYATFQDAVGNGLITLPSIMMTDEMPTVCFGGNCGFTVDAQIFVCTNGVIFCDNYVTGGARWLETISLGMSF